MDLMYIIVLILIIVIVNIIIISRPIEKYQNYRPYRVNYGRGYNLTFPMNLEGEIVKMSNRAITTNNIESSPKTYNCPSNNDEAHAIIKDTVLQYILKVACFRLKLDKSKPPMVDRRTRHVTVYFDTSSGITNENKTDENLFKMIACNPLYVEFISNKPNTITQPYLIKYVNNNEINYTHKIEISKKDDIPSTMIVFEKMDSFETMDISSNANEYDYVQLSGTDGSEYMNIKAYYLDNDLHSFQKTRIVLTPNYNISEEPIVNEYIVYDKNFKTTVKEPERKHFMDQLDFFLRQNETAPPFTISGQLTIDPQKISSDLTNKWHTISVMTNQNENLLFYARLLITNDMKHIHVQLVTKTSALRNKRLGLLFSDFISTDMQNLTLPMNLDSKRINNYYIKFTITPEQAMIYMKCNDNDQERYTKEYIQGRYNYIHDYFKEKKTTDKLIIYSALMQISYLRIGYENYISENTD